MIDVVSLQRKTEHYEFADGIRDFHTAFWLVVVGVFAWLSWDMPSEGLRSLILNLRAQSDLFAAVIIFGVTIGVPLLLSQGAMMLVNRTIRPRWLWRNTGVVTAKRWVMPRRYLFASLALMIGVFVGGILLAMQLQDFWIIVRGLYVGTGLELAFMYLMLANRFQLARYRLIAGVGLAGTVVIVLLPVTAGLAGLMVCLFWAVVLAVSGIYAMRDMMRQQEIAYAA